MTRVIHPIPMTVLLGLFVGIAAWAAWSTGAAAAAPAGVPAGSVIYTKDKPPKTPALEELPLKESVSQYGITWTFDKPARVGRFITGDFYVVGPVTISAITPEPKDGRNGSCLNIRNGEKAGFDSRHGSEAKGGRFDPKLFLAPPIRLKPGDSLSSSISLKEIGKAKKLLWSGGTNVTPVETVAVLTCLAAPAPADAFRPSYVGGSQRLYLARDLKRDLLPRLSREGVNFTCDHFGKFTIQDVAGWCQRPWIDVVLDEFTVPVANMPAYGREFVRVVGVASLALCLDFPPQEKEPLLINFVQIGIDLWGMAGQGGQPSSWGAMGGHGNGRKWPILFAGMMLGDAEMQAPLKKYPYVKFSEDTQTMFGPSWTGAKVVWAGHSGKDGATAKHPDRGAYEHLQPADWKGNTGENYRRCCTSNAWVGEALAARILHAEKVWDHDAFFAYNDRWMTEDDTAAVAKIKEAKGWDYSADWGRQGSVWDPFVKDLWKKYRDNLPPAPDGAKTPKAAETWK